MSEYKYIQQLIDRFFDGETTSAEEQKLVIFFQKENIPDDLRPYQSIFRSLEKDKLEKILEIPSIDTAVPGFLFSNRWRLYATGIAASLLVAVSFINQVRMKQPVSGIYEESYIIYNGEKITDPDILFPVIETHFQKVLEQEREMELSVLDALLYEYSLLENQ